MSNMCYRKIPPEEKKLQKASSHRLSTFLHLLRSPRVIDSYYIWNNDSNINKHRNINKAEVHGLPCWTKTCQTAWARYRLKCQAWNSRSEPQYSSNTILFAVLSLIWYISSLTSQYLCNRIFQLFFVLNAALYLSQNKNPTFPTSSFSLLWTIYQPLCRWSHQVISILTCSNI